MSFLPWWSTQRNTTNSVVARNSPANDVTRSPSCAASGARGAS